MSRPSTFLHFLFSFVYIYQDLLLFCIFLFLFIYIPKMLDYAKLTGNFASVANGLNHNQQKNTSQLTHNQLNHSWRRMINAIDEVSFR